MVAPLACSSCRAADATVVSLPDQTPVCSVCAKQQRAPPGQQQREVELIQPEKPHMCDICQDSPAYCICVEERAVLCRDCDISIHSSNKFTAKHSRFLFVGLRVGLGVEEKAEVKGAVSGGKRKAGSALSNGNGKQPMPSRFASGGGTGMGGAMHSSMMSTSPQLVPNGNHQFGSPSGIQPNGMPNGGIAMAGGMAVGGGMYGGGGGQVFGGMAYGGNPNGAGPSNGGASSSGMDHYGNYNAPASDFLGVPEMSGTFTIKDVDAAYMADEFGQYAPIGVPDDVSTLLEVPDLDFGSFGMHGQQGGNHGGWGDDGVVPDISYQH